MRFLTSMSLPLELSGPLHQHRAALGRGFESHSLRTASVRLTPWFSYEPTHHLKLISKDMVAPNCSTGVLESLRHLKTNSLRQKLSNLSFSCVSVPPPNQHTTLFFWSSATSKMHLHTFLMPSIIDFTLYCCFSALVCLLIHTYCIYICWIRECTSVCQCVCVCVSFHVLRVFLNANLVNARVAERQANVYECFYSVVLFSGENPFFVRFQVSWLMQKY